MKRSLTNLRWISTAAWLLLAVLLLPAAAQQQLDQSAVLYSNSTNYQRGVNYRSERGVPLSRVVGTPPGSDGRALTLPSAPTPNQFRGFVSYGAIVRPKNIALTATAIGTRTNLSQLAADLEMPRSTNNVGGIVFVLRSSQAGAPFFSRQLSFLFGAVIPPPLTDEGGRPLQPADQATYWNPEPSSLTGHTNAGYYWSPHAGAVFANQDGPIQITWRKATPVATQPTGPFTNIAGQFYTLTNASYVVSGSAVKPPQKIYWTEGVFRPTGKPVTVPTARVNAVKIVYNSRFPERVTEEYVALGQSSIVTVATNRLQELRTLWYDTQQGQIFAYNKEGRVFFELLGDSTGGDTKRHLGYEIVDVFQQPVPVDLSADLGEKITPYVDPNTGAELTSSPVLAGGLQSFLYRQGINGSDQVDYYAAAETINLNDVLVHWLTPGVQGLLWPKLFDRYKLIWPVNVARYSHYVRPVVATEQEAALTAVPLPTENVPTIQYQDPLDQPRGKLTDKFEYYTFLTTSQPAHRALLRFTSGDRVAFERVFSWLDVNLKNPATFAGTVATNLANWNPSTLAFDWNAANAANRFIAPRVLSLTATVGTRIVAPDGELGATNSYLAGFILQTNGNSFHPLAYQDPFVVGFEAANLGAIIPVNAIPGANNLDVWWFRRNPTNAVRNVINGFKPVYWPAVIARYALQWPANPSEIILASNDGSGPLNSLQAVGTIYTQNDPALPGYNPNEEHALMLGGQAYALRDDLNKTAATVPAVLTGASATYSSEPFVLVDYFEVMAARRCAPSRCCARNPRRALSLITS